MWGCKNSIRHEFRTLWKNWIIMKPFHYLIEFVVIFFPAPALWSAAQRCLALLKHYCWNGHLNELFLCLDSGCNLIRWISPDSVCLGPWCWADYRFRLIDCSKLGLKANFVRNRVGCRFEGHVGWYFGCFGVVAVGYCYCSGWCFGYCFWWCFGWYFEYCGCRFEVRFGVRFEVHFEYRLKCHFASLLTDHYRAECYFSSQFECCFDVYFACFVGFACSANRSFCWVSRFWIDSRTVCHKHRSVSMVWRWLASPLPHRPNCL